MVTDTKMKIGIYLTPDFTLPFLIVDIIRAEKNEVITNDTTAKILKSVWVTPVPEKLSPTGTLAAAVLVGLSAVPRFCTTLISTPDNAKRNGAAAIVAKVMKIT